jgi:hypothetical protein
MTAPLFVWAVIHRRLERESAPALVLLSSDGIVRAFGKTAELAARTCPGLELRHTDEGPMIEFPSRSVDLCRQQLEQAGHRVLLAEGDKDRRLRLDGVLLVPDPKEVVPRSSRPEPVGAQ